MKVLTMAPFDAKYLELIEQKVGTVVKGPQEEDYLIPGSQLIQLLKEELPTIVIIEINRIPTEVLLEATSLRVIAVCRSGVDNVDIEAATERGILVINAPGRNAVAVAELIIAEMISIVRNLVKSVNLIKDHQWADMVKTCYALEGVELAKRTAGIIGLGAIGKKVAKRLAAFEMRLLGYDQFVDHAAISELGVELTSLENLMKESDFVLLLAADTGKNQGMINAELLSLMKSDAYFVNMARSVLVDEEALLIILREKKIAGAVLDVHSIEPLPFDSPWLSLDNVLLTPHIGGATREVITNHSQMITDDLIRFTNGERPLNLANPQVWENKKQ